MCIEFLIQNGILLHFLSHLSYQYEVLVTNVSEKTFPYLGEVIHVIESVWSNCTKMKQVTWFCVVGHLVTFTLPFKEQD